MGYTIRLIFTPEIAVSFIRSTILIVALNKTSSSHPQSTEASCIAPCASLPLKHYPAYRVNL